MPEIYSPRHINDGTEGINVSLGESYMEYYILSFQQFIKDFIHEPHKVITASLLFCILSIPIISVGIAITFCLLYIRNGIEGLEFKIINELPKALKRYGKKATLLWIIDLCALLFMIGSIFMMGNVKVDIYLRFTYLIFFFLDGLFIFSMLFQFPLLINNDFSVKEILVKSIILSQKNLLFTVMIYCVILTLLIISVLTSVGVILIFPGGIAVLLNYAYKSMVLKYEKSTS